MTKLIGTFVLAVMLGCAAHTVKAPVPGALNSFDADSYQTLMTAQATLNSLKSTAATTPSLKPILNQAISSYDVAETAWQAYHAAASTATQAALTTSLSDLNTKVSTLQAAAAGGK
jgi:hypothetical protein